MEEDIQDYEMDLDDSSYNSDSGYENDSISIDTSNIPTENNIQILNRLITEATVIITENTPLSEGWYDKHFKYMYDYSRIDWDNLIERFRNKDNIIYDLAQQVRMYIQDILDDYSGKPDFEFAKYYTVLCNIQNLWRYYSDTYMGGETDTDVIDLIECFTFMM